MITTIINNTPKKYRGVISQYGNKSPVLTKKNIEESK
jgi:hypothetical protein